MPTLEDYPWADAVHPKMLAGPRYGCVDHAERGPYLTQGQQGWTEDGRRLMRHYPVAWLPVQCGHEGRAEDEHCAGCQWQGWRMGDGV